MIWLLGISFLLFLIMGIPVAFCLGISSLACLFIKPDIPLLIIPQKMFSGTDSFPLMAVPFFMLAGSLMNRGGITKRLIRFSNILVGSIRGGLAMVNVVASMFFAGITGAAVADTSAMGTILIPAMVKERYDVDFSAAITASSSTVGPIIPPSIPMIIYGVYAGVSIGKLFLAGIIPGVILGFSLLGVAYIISVKRGYPKGKKVGIREFFVTLKEASLALIMPVIIIGGIVFGIFTATEAAVVAVFYAFFVGFFVYGELKIKDLPHIIIESGITTSIIMLVIANASIFGWIIAHEQIPQKVANLFLFFTHNKWLILLFINIFLLFVGTFLETTASLIILTPILLPLATSLGIEPIHFGIIMVLNLVIGLTTPPLGVCLFVACSIAHISLEKISRAIIPFLLTSIFVLFLVTYIPQLSLII
ncbi:MAG: C4-dicarboxylate ABC transporter permease, partial [Spirochaetes bacterium]